MEREYKNREGRQNEKKFISPSPKILIIEKLLVFRVLEKNWYVFFIVLSDSNILFPRSFFVIFTILLRL